MQTDRPYTLTIAGFDPCSGAGLTADIKTFEQLKVYGLAICTGWTLQTEDKFYSVEWRRLEEVEKELDVMLQTYPIKAVKFGIVPSLDWLIVLTRKIKSHSEKIPIVVDPVWKSSTGFEFADIKNEEKLRTIFKNIDLLTPNTEEVILIADLKDPHEAATKIASQVAVLLKGGHNNKDKGTDWFYNFDRKQEIRPGKTNVWPKHGSGCVLSAAITASMAKGKNGFDACRDAKIYIEKYLNSNRSLLGFHAS
ncbi:MAG: phosphomethylpyrimidine kinase [Bacteroidetes bacterium]|jgi:hydroxymethylpyrimidine/phosphomethylpyrimidine kinase|nr:phosphomethylpyrimidine kinase [Bacteroidota bacterium]